MFGMAQPTITGIARGKNSNKLLFYEMITEHMA